MIRILKKHHPCDTSWKVQSIKKRNVRNDEQQKEHIGEETLLALLCRVYVAGVVQLYSKVLQTSSRLSGIKPTTVMVIRSNHSTKKQIDRNNGGVIASEEKGVYVHFPKHSFKTSFLDASLTVLPSEDSSYHHRHPNCLPPPNEGGGHLATHVVALGPCGTVFDKNVRITLPLTKEIQTVLRKRQSAQGCRFTIMVSQTLPGEVPKWEILNTPYKTTEFSPHSNNNISLAADNAIITFEVPHFSLYKVVWSCVDHVLPETIKLRASDSIAGFSFRTKFEARMTNCNHRQQFALCIQAYRGREEERVKSNKQIRQQYPLQVGSCNAKTIKTGKLRIRLKSDMFVADHSVGEDSLTKDIDFHGHDIDAQFSCLSTASSSVPELEIFGKVFVSLLDADGAEQDGTHFSFNLIKKNQQTSQKESINTMSKDSSLMHVSESQNRKTLQTTVVQESRKEIASFDKPSQSATTIRDLKFQTPQHLSNNNHQNPIMEKVPNLTNFPSNHHRHQHQTSSFDHQSCLGCCKEKVESQLTVAAGISSHHKRKRSYHEAFYDDPSPLDECEMDDIAEQISDRWRNVGRKLNLTESCLKELNLRGSSISTEREKAFQMLLEWRERFPEAFTRGSNVVCCETSVAMATSMSTSFQVERFETR